MAPICPWDQATEEAWQLPGCHFLGGVSRANPWEPFLIVDQGQSQRIPFSPKLQLGSLAEIRAALN